jgi:glyoxylase-like metal-dependent hydrolase (beta-lactamase superfamily II)
VILLPAGNASAWTGPTGNNTYLLSGGVPTLIDAGVGNADHLDALARALGGARLAQVLLTHDHIDHVAGVPALRARWPGVIVRQFGTGEHPPGEGRERPLADGERIAAGDAECTVLHTPGHAPDHCCFVRGGDLFCGDLARIGGTIVIPASRGGDLALYLESLQRVRELKPARLLPAHGPIVDNPEALIDQYVAHRRMRDDQILDVLQAGASTPPAIVDRVYGALPDQLGSAAADTVLAHLIKLRNEGRVKEHDGSWWHNR